MSKKIFLKKYPEKENLSLLKKIEKSDTIVFDIFNILLVKNILNQDDLFFFMEQDIRNILGNERSLIFRRTRVLAEEIAKKQYTKSELSIDLIYNVLQDLTDISNLEKEKIKELELIFEEKLLYSREYGKDIYNLCKHLNKKIIFVSNSYLPEYFVKRILLKNLYNDNEIFYNITNYKNISIKKSLYLKSDTNKSKDKSLLVIPGSMSKAQKNIKYLNQIKQSQNTSFSNRSILSTITNKLFSNPYKNKGFLQGSIYNIGYSIYGPLVLGLTIDMIKKSKERNIDTILFFERDAYIPKIVFDKLKTYLNAGNIKTYSFFINRNIINMFSIKNYKELLSRYSYSTPVSQTLKTILCNLSKKEINKILLKNNIDPNTKTFETNISKLSNILFKHYPKYQESKKEYIDYVEKILQNINFGTLGTFDIGYQGSSDMFLSMIVPQYTQSYHFYLMCNTGNTYHKLPYCSFLGDIISSKKSFDYNTFSEIALSNIKTQEEIARDNNLVYFSQNSKHSKISEGERKKIKELQLGIIDFIDDVIDKSSLLLDNYQISNSFLIELLKYLENTEKEDMFSISFSDYGNIVTLNSIPRKFNLTYWSKENIKKWKQYSTLKNKKLYKKYTNLVFLKYILSKTILIIKNKL